MTNLLVKHPFDKTIAFVRLLGLLSCVALLPIVLSIAQAQLDHDEIKVLRDSGAILPLSAILTLYHQQAPSRSRILDATLEKEDGGYVYELKILQEDGAVLEIEYNGVTGEVIEVEWETDTQQTDNQLNSVYGTNPAGQISGQEPMAIDEGNNTIDRRGASNGDNSVDTNHRNESDGHDSSESDNRNDLTSDNTSDDNDNGGDHSDSDD